ncbi:MAG TPA: hypothetical protein VGJ63_14820 [Micromonosporaceae bacterium]
MWPDLEAIEHTLAYDAACRETTGHPRPPPSRWRTAIVPSIPRAERMTRAGQSRVADPTAVAPVLDRFFGAKLMG